MAPETAKEVAAFGPDQVLLLPLYPHYSMTTTGSSAADWHKAAKAAKLAAPTKLLCCYPAFPRYTAALTRQLVAAIAEAKRRGGRFRVLLSAHGLPKKVIASGDPYQWQVERTAKALVDRLGIEGLDWQVCYQSRVGPLKWLEPATDAEIARAGRNGKGVILAPIAFVSEHSETLVELDIEYARLARTSGVPDYRRAATVSADPLFISGLSRLVRRAMDDKGVISSGNGRLCPAAFCRCAQEE
jgi:ferrochelatase